MKILGIETSCDETAVAIYCQQRGLLAHQVFTQIKLHQVYGGVVPEIAARDHAVKLLPLVDAALQEADMNKTDLDAIAYTKGPGLIGPLMVGAALAQSLAFGLDIPAVGIHHMEAHLMAVMLEEQVPSYPFLALLVSGGHTLLVEVRALGDYTILGQSVDDAVGEAFDKTAKCLGLPYPGGPSLEHCALQGNPKRFKFPRPMTNRPGYDFSFSGLKTHVVNVVAKQQLDNQTQADIAYAFQEAAVSTLIIKCRRALEATGLTQLAIVGGVSANQRLRTLAAKELSSIGVEVFYPRHEFCTDNGAMVAYTGFLRYKKGDVSNLVIDVRPRWPMDQLV